MASWRCIFGLLLATCYSSVSGEPNPVWHWQCLQGTCQKQHYNETVSSSPLSLPTCRLSCSDAAGLWPKPTGDVSVSNIFQNVNFNSIDVVPKQSNSPSSKLVREAGKVFKEQIQATIPRRFNPKGGKSLLVDVDIKNPSFSRLTLDTDESYTLKLSETSDGRLNALISAQTFFGARHGLQTLNQLIVFDDLKGELLIPSEALITDKPAYPYRGIVLDTSRNYITIDAIKRTLAGMGASKLNTFHWHITDSHSFPYVSKSRPELSKYGAYSPSKVYTDEDIKQIIKYATVRGIRVLPEFDAPAHVGEGWQNTGFVTCLNWQPWQSYCVEPPCGQLDPTKDGVYDVLEDIYGDMIEQFQPDIFHMGGDEVNFHCWKSTPNIAEWMQRKGLNVSEEKDLVQLWRYFQDNALQRLDKKAKRNIPVVMWTSHLTDPEYLTNALPKDRYIIQIWTTGTDAQVGTLLENGYKVILSNYDALYFDCGFAGWVTSGNNWCSPYIGWQKVYSNTPEKIAGPTKKHLVLGEEAALWTEQADSASVDSRLWPRAAALAEAVWTSPANPSWEAAEQRFLAHRERLVELGIGADAIEPEWCLQHEENCRIGAKLNTDTKFN
ncbi:unnamed protein product [Acanthoscelides obtectus]|uniref:Beta-hexosaminidase n=1 Tax=Acanthoscelides obtectus TaxID=200917 RepID=A0A9P0PI77_ACAOB|nr:unnamed protein product [Acanthoscelides obtectus]CAK1656767.1 hypothetical protein AOBTE_LOCUS19901 [Acanthoscelides obtectus]